MLILAIPSPAGASQNELPSADTAIDLLGFKAAEKKQLRAGQTVTREVQERADELVVSFARAIPRPIDSLLDEVRSGKLGWLGEEVLAMAEIDVSRPLEEAFKTATFGSDEQAEIDGLLAARPGSRFNLSVEELQRFGKLRQKFGAGSCKGDPVCAAAVMAEYQAVLAGRVRAYLHGGVASLAPYAREGGKTSDPGAALLHALRESRLLASQFPTEYRSLQGYPATAADASDHYFWIKVDLQGRPTFVLAHRRIYAGTVGTILVERQFYAGNSCNAMQILAGAVPDGAGTMLFYTNRLFTDLVAGALQSMRHSVGRNRLRKTVLDYMDKIAAAR